MASAEEKTPGRLYRIKFKSVISIDLETTDRHVDFRKGLKTTDENRPRITEVAMAAVPRAALTDGASFVDGYPRVTDEIRRCFHPGKPICGEAEKITGLNLNNLKYQKDFDEKRARHLIDFIQQQERPVCVIAHNGLRFDFPVLRAELQSIGLDLPTDRDIVYADSLQALQDIDAEYRLQIPGEESPPGAERPEPVPMSNRWPARKHPRYRKQEPSGYRKWEKRTDREDGFYSLRNLKKKLLGDSSSAGEHTAMGDVRTLLKIICKYEEVLCGWMEKNCVRYGKIRADPNKPRTCLPEGSYPYHKEEENEDD